MMTENYLDDNVVIPEEIMKMIPKEVKNEIARIRVQDLKSKKKIKDKKAV